MGRLDIFATTLLLKLSSAKIKKTLSRKFPWSKGRQKVLSPHPYDAAAITGSG